jgi:hypothetical protein
MDSVATGASRPASLAEELIIEDLPWYKRLLLNAPARFYLSLAALNKFDYQAQGTLDMFSSSLNKLQGKVDIRNVITGHYGKRAFRLFTAELTLSKQKGGWDDTIIEITLPHQVPPILITHSGENIRESISPNNGIDLTGTFGSFSRATTENPDFNKRLVAHVKPGDEVEGLQILSPDVIEILVGSVGDFRDIEIVGNKLYVYLDDLVITAKKLLPAFELIDKLAPKLQLLSNDFS